MNFIALYYINAIQKKTKKNRYNLNDFQKNEEKYVISWHYNFDFLILKK